MKPYACDPWSARFRKRELGNIYSLFRGISRIADALKTYRPVENLNEKQGSAMTAIIELEPASAVQAHGAATSLERVIVQVAEGDRQALKALYSAIAPKLFAVLVRMLKRREMAEDALQDVFVSVWQKAGQFDPARGTATSWLFSITRRKGIDALRRHSRESTGAACDIAEHECGEVVQWFGPETEMAIRTCLNGMKPEVRQAVILCFTYGLTHEEVAAELNVPLGTAKSWVRRALLHIRHYLDEDALLHAAE